jgi:hypothetical protein
MLYDIDSQQSGDGILHYKQNSRSRRINSSCDTAASPAWGVGTRSRKLRCHSAVLHGAPAHLRGHFAAFFTVIMATRFEPHMG